MTQPRELDRLLTAFFAAGTDELADRVIDAALDQIDHSPQRHAMRAPWRFRTMTLSTRLAAAAVIGVLAVGGAFYLLRSNQPSVGTPTQSPSRTVVPTATTTPTSSSAALVLPGPMVNPRQIHTSTTLRDGRVLLTGGYIQVQVATSAAELYDPSAKTFTATGSMSKPRGLDTATLLNDGRVLVAGGGEASWAYPGSPYLALAELYDPATGSFTPTGSMLNSREDHTATLLADGRVLIAGGNDLADRTTASAEIYDPATGKFTATGSMTTARGFHTATLLKDGRVLITGGDVAAWTDEGPYLSSAEIYDPKTGTFTKTGTMADGRAYHAATLLANGLVLLTGGVTFGSATESLNSAEVYDPATGVFSRRGPMTTGRVYQTAALLAAGRVLIAGGLAHGRVYSGNPQFLASAELFNPLTDGFTATGSMAAERGWAAASVLADGRVVITGGASGGGADSLDSAEIFDPATGTFSPAG